jgi:hypothetical protein
MSNECTAQTGWVALAGQIIGNLENWQMSYMWDGEFYPDRETAVKVTMDRIGHDDFNVAHVEHGVLDWFGWMDEKHPEEDWGEPAAQFGWAVPASCVLAALKSAEDAAEVSR